jgi:uroporphyrinogen-III synthase
MPEPGPLTGFAVGITADRRWDEQAALFERRGATVVHGPTIRTVPLGEEGPLRAVTEEVISRPPAVLIANTGIGIKTWFGHAEAWGLGRELAAALGQTRIYARGPKASAAIRSVGLPVLARAASEQLREVVDLVVDAVQPGERVVLQLDGGPAPAEADLIRQAGGVVVPLPVYRWTLPEETSPARSLAERVIAGHVHAVTFTAGPAIRNWLVIAERAGLGDELRRALTDGRTVIGCVGPVCTSAAAEEGLLSPHLVQPTSFRIAPLVRAVADRLTAQA